MKQTKLYRPKLKSQKEGETLEESQWMDHLFKAQETPENSPERY